jgi:5-methylcytosine-specific restriction endonuclease McrA
MRNLAPPAVDDDAVLGQLKRSRSANAKSVVHRIADIGTRYAQYVTAHGNPWQVTADASFHPIREKLEDLYSRPPKALSHIPLMRAGIEGACPVCGRDSLGTLDHYLPKSEYAEYAFFSKNLIPACDRCNNARGNSVRGTNQGERPFHPYFDGFATRRLMTIDARPDWRAPDLTPVPFEVQGIERTVVQWHIENVIRPAGIESYMHNLWGRLVENASDFLGPIPTRDGVGQSLLRLMRIEEAAGSSPNAWRSCFYHGLAHNVDALDHLATLVP